MVNLMTTLLSAMNQTALTANGAVTNRSTLNECLDLFAIIGASRGKDITTTFRRAYSENPDVALRVLLWARDCRGGSGERKTVHDLIAELIKLDTPMAIKVIAKMPEVGYWKEVVNYVGHENPQVSEAALNLVIQGLASGNGLTAKWTPRKGTTANTIRKSLGLDPKGYRKLLVGLTTVVEQQMSANKWTEIEYSHVPSVAMSNYGKAFGRHDQERFGTFVTKAEKGEVKINSGVLFPHRIVYDAQNGSNVADAQWNQLPDYFEGNGESILPVLDVSGSMTWVTVDGPCRPIDVALGLGIYCSQRLNGPFKNQWVTFSESPVMQKLAGRNLKEIFQNMCMANVGGSTNLAAVFELILKQAKAHNLPASALPTKVMIVSDMEFNSTGSITNHDNIKRLYAESNYPMPQVVYWNVNAREGNMPVTINDKGVALISGFSPAIAKSVFGNISPVEVMMRAVGIPKYALE